MTQTWLIRLKQHLQQRFMSKQFRYKGIGIRILIVDALT